MNKPEIICHRGYHEQAIENSLESFALAESLGVDGIETDVRLTADGRAVLLHDRLLPTGVETRATEFAELSRILGSAPASLEDALTRFPSFHWMIELKRPEAMQPTLEAVARFRGERKMMLIGFWHPVMVQCARQCDIPVGLTFCHRPLRFADFSKSIQAQASSIHTVIINFEFSDSELMREIQDCGWQVYVYDTHTEADHRQCLDWGVTGIITDHPQQLANLLNGVS